MRTLILATYIIFGLFMACTGESTPQSTLSPTATPQALATPQPTATPPLTGSPTLQPTPTPTATSLTEEGEIYYENGAKEVLQLAIIDLAGKLGVSEKEIEVISVEPVDWPDTSLGNPQPGTFYLQVITPGYRIVLAANGKNYEYHTDLQRVVLVD